MKYITLSLFSILVLSVLVYFGLTYLKPETTLTKVEVTPSQTQEIVSGDVNTSANSPALEDDLTSLDRDLSEREDIEADFNNDFKTF